MSKIFLEAVKNRRSFYALSDEKIVPKERIEEILREAILHVPSPFNSQSTRMVVLFDEHHKRLWDITLEILRGITSPNQFEKTENKVTNAFRAGYGTVLFFEDQNVVEGLVKQFPDYAEIFPSWSIQANAMHQFVVWTALEAEGLGASLQHYNPLIDEDVRKNWSVPENWKLIAQMPFGKPLSSPGEKEFSSVDERLKVF
ncbi:MAG: nitroreductase family protein [Eubacteriales bacterium]|jgi:predicted oxidoreductase (fatty acid repression mutant protein)|nr:nitroreductase family protein [Eubacteriales bacterium]